MSSQGSSMTSATEIWVLGATGRFGREAARILVRQGADVVLVGRDHARLEAVRSEIGASRVVVGGDVAAMADAITEQRPSVVLNTVGPFSQTAPRIVDACLPHSSYVDIANDYNSASTLVSMHDAAVAAGRTLVTGAAFGVVGTEAPLRVLCDDHPGPVRVRVDSAASLTLQAGRLGEALAATILETIPNGGRRIRRGELIRAGLGSLQETLHFPDGTDARAGAWPSGDLLAAHRASNAPDVVAASTEMAMGGAVRALLPIAAALLRVRMVRRFLTKRLANMRLTDKPMPRPSTWGRAWAQWDDGTTRTAWLRAGDTNDFTAAVPAFVALHLSRGEARHGAGTPVEMAGLGIVAEAGGEILQP